VTLEAENKIIEGTSQLTLDFQPLHQISKDATIKLEISSELTIVCQLDVIRMSMHFNPDFQLKKSDCELSPDGLYNVILIKKALLQDYFYEERRSLKIVFPFSKNPLSSMDITRLRISMLIPEYDYLVDFYDSPGKLFNVRAAPFFEQTVKSSVEETFTESSLTFSLTVANTVNPGAVL